MGLKGHLPKLSKETMIDRNYALLATTWTLGWSPMQRLSLRFERPAPLWKIPLLRRGVYKAVRVVGPVAGG